MTVYPCYVRQTLYKILSFFYRNFDNKLKKSVLDSPNDYDENQTSITFNDILVSDFDNFELLKSDKLCEVFLFLCLKQIIYT